MKKLKSTIALIAACVLTASFTACANGNASLLVAPAAAAELDYQERREASFQSYLEKVEDFAEVFSPAAYSALENKENYVSSPISVYLALSLLAECTGSETRQEILDALGVTYTQLTTHSAALYRLLNETHIRNKKEVGLIKATNSVWIDDSITAKEKALSSLANNYYCYAYSANFTTENEEANAAVQKFVKEQTNGLIDKNFGLSNETIFSLVNTLYLKDGWKPSGDDLKETTESYSFTQLDGTTVQQKLLQGLYKPGQAQEKESYTTFFTSTNHGYTLHFILPKDGYTTADIFTQETLTELKSIDDYLAEDEEANTKYFTRCIFPKFEASYDEEISAILYSLGISQAFNPHAADFSPFTDAPAFVGTVKHVAKLEVDEEGIEGAAATIIGVTGSAEPPKTTVYADFVVDKAFGFVLTDPYGATLFSGVVNKI